MSEGELDSDGKRRRRAWRHLDDRRYNARRRARVEALRAAQRIYNSVQWKKLRAAFLLENPLCATCMAKGKPEGARDVDHRIPLAVQPDLAYEWDNLQALCRPCHNRKTRAEKAQAERSPMTVPPSRDPKAPPAAGTAHLADGVRVELSFPAGTPDVLRARVRMHLQRWADQVAQVLGFSPTVVTKEEPDAEANPRA